MSVQIYLLPSDAHFDAKSGVTFLKSQQPKSILKIGTSRQPLRGPEDHELGIKKAEMRKERASIKDARKFLRLVESAKVQSQDSQSRLLADVDAHLTAARAEYKWVLFFEQTLVSYENEDIRITLRIFQQGLEQARSLVDIDKRVEVACEEVEEALSAKITVTRQQKEEEKAWQKIHAQISQETAREAAR